MNKYYYSNDGPSQLIIKKNQIYYALLYSEYTLCDISQEYIYYPLTIGVLLKRQNWFRTPMEHHYKHHLKLALKELANE